MKTIERIAGCILTLMLVTSVAFAQQVDQNKMSKDIEIAEEILLAMLKRGEETPFSLVREPIGMHVEGYGVIFNVTGSHFPRPVRVPDFDFHFDFDDSFAIDTEKIKRMAQRVADESRRVAHETARIMQGDKGMIIVDSRISEEEEEEIQKEVEEEMREVEKEMEKEARKAEKRARKAEKEAEKLEDELEALEELEELDVILDEHPVIIHRQMVMKPEPEDMEVFKAKMIDFLVDYGSLIGQLQSDHKIMISSGMGGRRHYGRSYFQGKMTLEITKSDLVDYKNGKLTRDELVEKIRISESDENQETVKDLELFSTIFERLYEHDLAETYYISRGLHYERLGNFGVIYTMKVYSSKENDGTFSLPTQNLHGLTMEQRNRKVEEMYPIFEAELKENIIEYAKTIKSLAPSETLLFQVTLTECKGCKMPERIDVSVTQSVLADYDAGKISKNAALNKIRVKKY